MTQKQDGTPLSASGLVHQKNEENGDFINRKKISSGIKTNKQKTLTSVVMETIQKHLADDHSKKLHSQTPVLRRNCKCATDSPTACTDLAGSAKQHRVLKLLLTTFCETVQLRDVSVKKSHVYTVDVQDKFLSKILDSNLLLICSMNYVVNLKLFLNVQLLKIMCYLAKL